MAKELWVEKYRPSTVKDYVFKDNTQRKQVQNWINDGGIPHLLFSGSPGTGKTTIAKVLINELSIEDADVLYINASRDNGVEMIRKKITAFSETMPWGDFKVILLDEADHISPEGQAALRGVMEQYHASVRFILTCNYPNMIIPALHSRCQGFHIEKLDQTDFTIRVAEILADNSVEFDIDTLDAMVRANYPDLRKTINTVQMSIADNLLQKPVDDSGASAVWRMDMIDLFKTGNIKAARELIVSKARTDEYNEIYTWLYRNLDLYTNTDAQYDDCVLAIRNGLVKHTQVADVEINLSATMIDLARAL
jgi:replication factor C small subunit|tara:strand:+ start:1463 stop:2386 length:924 start_codon:yes stop_codon:yes gene_type:complete